MRELDLLSGRQQSYFAFLSPTKRFCLLIGRNAQDALLPLRSEKAKVVLLVVTTQMGVIVLKRPWLRGTIYLNKPEGCAYIRCCRCSACLRVHTDEDVGEGRCVL